jgi:hypothetical protein
VNHTLATAVAALILLLSGCTSMGHHNPNARQQVDFGPPETVRICLYLDQGISEAAGRSLVENAWKDQAGFYGIDIEVARVTRWKRPAFDMDGILAELRKLPLEAPCDRIFALIGRNIGDVAWGLVGPEILGAVNAESLTHGYAVASRASVAQLLSSPQSVVEHEIYHLLGCGEHSRMNNCYQRIAQLKRWKRDTEADFFPAWDMVNGRMLQSRVDVNSRLEPFGNRRLAMKE